MNVIKRNKNTQPFDIEKVRAAIGKAFAAVGVNMPDDITSCIESQYNIDSPGTVDVEDIQDSIERCLMDSFPEVAKAFIIYRAEHKTMRDNDGKLMKGIVKKLMATNVENQNANVDEHSFGGRIGEAARLATKEAALKYLVTNKTRRNHERNEIYLHDLDSYFVGMHNCLTVPFDDLLKNGCSVRQTDIRPAASINTAFQLVAVLFQLQSLQQFGGVSSSHLDWTMVPYVRKSFTKHLGDGMAYIEGKSEYKTKNFHKWLKHNPHANDDVIHLDDEDFKNQHPKAWEYALDMTKRELDQAVEGMYHNLNTLSTLWRVA